MAGSRAWRCEIGEKLGAVGPHGTTRILRNGRDLTSNQYSELPCRPDGRAEPESLPGVHRSIHHHRARSNGHNYSKHAAGSVAPYSANYPHRSAVKRREIHDTGMIRRLKRLGYPTERPVLPSVVSSNATSTPQPYGWFKNSSGRHPAQSTGREAFSVFCGLFR
jgi:hypothetical protein